MDLMQTKQNDGAPPVVLVVKNLPASAGICKRHRRDAGLIPGLGNGNLLQYFCRENPMGRKAWQVTVHGVAKSHSQPSN